MISPKFGFSKRFYCFNIKKQDPDPNLKVIIMEPNLKVIIMDRNPKVIIMDPNPKIIIMDPNPLKYKIKNYGSQSENNN